MKTDCSANEYCKVAACAAIGGTCTAIPPTTNALSPVCGCDNLTYYNDSLAAAAGVNVASSGACGAGAIACRSQGPGQAAVKCPAGSKCDYEATQCSITGFNVPGTCWVLPKQCPANEVAPYKACNQFGNDCAGLCAMIDAEKPFAKDTETCK